MNHKFDKNISLQFKGVGELAEHIRATPPHPDAGECSIEDNPRFYGPLTLDDALHIASDQHGYYPEGAEALGDIALKLPAPATPAPTIARRPKRNYAGSRPHVAAHIAGSPKAMLQPTRAPRFKPVIKVLIQVNTPANTTTTQVNNRGAAVLGLVQKLERSGRQVELHALIAGFDTIEGKKVNMDVSFCVKPAGDKLAPADMAFVCTSPAMHRRLTFALYERSPDFYQVTRGGYAANYQVKPEAHPDYDLVIPALMREGATAATTLDGAVEHLSAMVNKQLSKTDTPA